MVLAVAIAVIAFVLLPHVIARREAITQSREYDRFSPHMRVLRTDGPAHAHEECRPTEMRLLPVADVPPTELPGGAMPTNTERAARPGARTRAGGDTPTHQIAHLRAHRAARLANERAAGLRRMVATVAAAVLTVSFVVLAGLGLMRPAWVLLPAVVLAAAVVTSRMAAIRSERIEREEESRMVELRARRRAGVTRAAHLAAPTVAAARGAAERGERFVASDRRADTEAGEPSGQSVAPARAERGAAPEEGAAEQGGSARTPDRQPDVEGPAVAAVAAVERAHRPWTPTPVPAPTWSNRPRVEGRTVHADTDLRGIPRVGAAPARPTTAQGMPEGARSTEQVAAAQPIAFDLDEVLENRRAQ